MTLAGIDVSKSVLPEKAGEETPTALLGHKSMSQSEPTDHNSDVTCPTCDDSFGTVRAMKSHHAQAHNQSIAGERAECDHCNKTFRASVDSPGVYCSNECQAAAQRDRVELTCSQCGKKFSRKPNRAGAERPFCSCDCRDSFLQNRAPEDHPRWLGPRKEKVCEHCGEEFKAIPGPKGRDRFCSLNCSRSHDRKGASYETISMAVRTRLPNGWSRWRSDLRTGECEMCGCTAEERAHDLHHIVPILAGGVNTPELLVELCRQCHERAEKYTRDQLDMEAVLVK